MAEDREQAYQDPTAARLRRAEQAGQFAHSRELATAIIWLGGVAILATFGATLCHWLTTLARSNWSTVGSITSADELARQQWATSLTIFWKGLMPMLGGLAVIAMITHWSQSGFRFFPHLAAPDPNRLNPKRNLSRILGLENLVSVSLGIAKFVVLLAVAAWILIGDWHSLILLGRGTLESSSATMGDWLVAATIRLCLAAVVIGLVDYSLRWQLHRRSLRMTEQEIREERRSTEPSPEIDARRRLLTRR